MSRKRILLVEDDFDLADIGAMTLVELGYDVLGPALTAQAALDLLSGTRPDGAIVDLNLGHRPSYPVLDELARQQTPVVILTGYDDPAMPAAYAAIKRCRKPASVAAAIEMLFD